MVAAIYEESTHLCSTFTEVVFMHCPSEANMASHVLASHSDAPHYLISVIGFGVSLLPDKKIHHDGFPKKT